MEREITTACTTCGHPEIEATYDPAYALGSDVRATLSYFEREVASGRMFEAGQSVQVGWMDVILKQGESNTLVLTEPDWTGNIPIRYVSQVTRTIGDIRRQREVAESLGLLDLVCFPSILHSGIACTRFDASSCGLLERDSTQGSDSGWFFGCNDPKHHHSDPSELRRESLYSIACRVPAIVGFCALPPQIRIEFDEVVGSKFLLSGKILEIKKGSFLERLLRKQLH